MKQPVVFGLSGGDQEVQTLQLLVLLMIRACLSPHEANHNSFRSSSHEKL